MPENITPQREALPSIEQTPPSPALKIRIARGEFDRPDPSKPIDTTLPPKVDHKAFVALENLNHAKRKADREAFVQKVQATTDHPLSADDMKHAHMFVWASHVQQALAYDLKIEGRGNKTALILRDKLGFPLTGNGQEDGHIVRDQLYNPETRTEGAFYKKFCARNMPEQLANALSVDDMMHLKTFLVTWMLGSEADFAALVALRQTMDDVAHAATKQATYTQYAQLPLDDRDRLILTHFRKGLQLGEETITQQPNPSSQSTQEPIQETSPAQPEEKTSPLSGSVSEKSEHHEHNEDSSFIDEKTLRGGIFDGASGHYRGDIASQTAEKAVTEILATLSPKATLEEVQQKIAEAMRMANDRVLQITYPEGQDHPITTGTIYQVWKGPNGEMKLVFSSLGDSRLWIRKANGEIKYLTKDDSTLKADYQMGIISPEEYTDRQRKIDTAQTQEDIDALGAYWKNRNIVTAMLGEQDVNFHIITEDIEPGDMIIVTSDGIHDPLSLSQIEQIAQSTDNPQELSEKLVAQARDVSNSDSVRAKEDDRTVVAQKLESNLPITSKNQTNRPLQSLTFSDSEFENPPVTDGEYARENQELLIKLQKETGIHFTLNDLLLSNNLSRVVEGERIFDGPFPSLVFDFVKNLGFSENSQMYERVNDVIKLVGISYWHPNVPSLERNKVIYGLLKNWEYIRHNPEVAQQIVVFNALAEKVHLTLSPLINNDLQIPKLSYDYSDQRSYNNRLLVSAQFSLNTPITNLLKFIQTVEISPELEKLMLQTGISSEDLNAFKNRFS